MLRYLLLVVAVLPLVGCQTNPSEEAPPHRFGAFFVRYLSGEDQIKATASILEGDSIQTADLANIPKGVSFQNQPMTFRPSPGGLGRFLLEDNMAYSATSEFRFSDSTGREQVYIIDMAPIDSFSIVGGEASLSGGLQLYLFPPLQAAESLVLFFSNEEQQATSVTLQGPLEGDYIGLPAPQLTNLTTGSYELYLIKKKRLVHEDKVFSTSGDVEYYSPPAEFEMKE